MHILFVTATRIGDAVLSTGLLSHLVERFPGARLTIAAGPVAAPLFEAVPGLDEVLVLRKRRWGLHWLPLYARPAANWRGKQWRAERFAELACRLTAAGGPLPGARIAVLAAAHERAQAAPLLAAPPPGGVIDLVGRTDLLTAAAVLRRASLFIGNDTGLMHIAAAAGTPTLGLFGPSPVEQYAPWGGRSAFVRTALPPEAMFPPGFDHRTTDTLMDSLSVEMAEAAARQLWRRAADTA